MVNKKISILVLLFLTTATQIYSHPHVFGKTAVSFNFQNNKLQSITCYWTFDEFFSNQILTACDGNRDKKLNRTEEKIVKKKFFDNLSNFGYFIKLWINKKYIPVKWVRNFKAIVVGSGKVKYSFDISTKSPILTSKKTLKLMFIDTSNFVAYNAAKKAIRFRGKKPFIIKALNNVRAQFQLEFKSF